MCENDRQDDPDGEHDDTQEQALPDFLRPDIGEFCLFDDHRKLPVLFIDFGLRQGLTAVIADIRVSG
jgi:hypothetical protein